MARRDLRAELAVKAAKLGAGSMRLVGPEEMAVRVEKAHAILESALERACEDPKNFDIMAHALAAVMLAKGAIAVGGISPEWFVEMIRSDVGWPDSVVVDLGKRDGVD